MPDSTPSILPLLRARDFLQRLIHRQPAVSKLVKDDCEPALRHVLIAIGYLDGTLATQAHDEWNFAYPNLEADPYKMSSDDGQAYLKKLESWLQGSMADKSLELAVLRFIRAELKPEMTDGFPKRQVHLALEHICHAIGNLMVPVRF